MISSASFIIIFFSIMALNTALLTATGIRHGILNELEAMTKEIKTGKTTQIFGGMKLKLTNELKETFVGRIQTEMGWCTLKVAEVAEWFRVGTILFIVELPMALGYDALLSEDFFFISSSHFFYILLFLMGVSLFILILNALKFAQMAELPYKLEKDLREELYKSALTIGIKKFRK